MTCGIYILYYETEDYQYYIGKSINIETRYKDHCSRLSSGTHKNRNLTKGFEAKVLPSISILEELPTDDNILNDREIYWIHEFDCFNNGMNQSPGGEGTGYGEDNPNSTYSNNKIKEVFLSIVHNPTVSLKNIADINNVPKGLISQITIGASHSWLSKDYPTEYAHMLTMLRNRGKGNSAKDRSISYPPLISPENNIYSVENTHAFAKEHNLNQGNLCSLLNGRAKTHKGWKVYKENLS